MSAFATGHLKEENFYVLHELADRVRQPSVLRECNLLEFGQGLLVAHLARPVLAQIRFLADSGLGRGHVLEIIDELYDALLRLPAKGQTDYITLGSRDSDVEICSAAKECSSARGGRIFSSKGHRRQSVQEWLRRVYWRVYRRMYWRVF